MRTILRGFENPRWRHYSEYLQSALDDSAMMEKLNTAGRLLLGAWLTQNTVWIIGNGGSAAQASHLACDLEVDISRRTHGDGIKAHALADRVTVNMAWSNDENFETALSRQAIQHMHGDDILIAFTTSGKSKNILMALDWARSEKLTTIVFTGKGGLDLAQKSTVGIVVPSFDTGVIQDVHHVLCHMMVNELVYLIELA